MSAYADSAYFYGLSVGPQLKLRMILQFPVTGTATALWIGMEQHPVYEGGQDIRDRTFQFACRAVAFCEALYAAGGVGRLMVPQLVSCATSVAAMLEEARAAESKRDFISKCNIGLKECRESRVRLRVCAARRYGPQNEAQALAGEAGELIAIVTAIVRNTRRNMPQEPPRIRNS